MSRLITAGSAHAAALAAIHATSFAEAARWDALALASLLRMPGACCLLDPDGAFVLARVAADDAEILTLAVAPALRRRKLGTALLRAAMQRCADRGAATMVLEVATANAAALALYRAEGFVPVGQRRRYYHDGGDAVLLRRALDADRRAGHPASP